jgi:hypothetical protein
VANQTIEAIDEVTGSIHWIELESFFDCGMRDDPAIIDKESTNENNADVGRWADARGLRINGKPRSKP